MNKTDLIDRIATHLDGDRKAAQTAVEAFIDVVQREVQRGRKVSISGFGVFEKRARAARVARNPRTGETVKVKKTNVPSFRPGNVFKDVVAGRMKLPRASEGLMTAREMSAAAARREEEAAAKKTAPKANARAAKKTVPTKPAAKGTTGTTATKVAPARATATKTAPTKAAATTTDAKKTAPKKTAPKKTAAKKTAAKKTAAKKS